jgi:NAD-dependent SIR2 family protein deacetylase
MARECRHSFVDGRKPGTVKCSNCKWQFPCRESTCGHSDCIEFKGKLPRCYYCKKQVHGPAQEEWVGWNIYGHTRAVHYSCRDAAADLDREATVRKLQVVQSEGVDEEFAIKEIR